MDSTGRPGTRGVVRRGLWVTLGLVSVAIGGVGVVVPGLPTTVFFICAAACFTRSSPRLEAWVLDLPGIGAAVRDHRAGLGMPRRAKILAGTSIVLFSSIALVTIDAPALRSVVGSAALVGLAVVVFRVPTRERVEARRVADPAG